ncbi:MAG: AbiA family abortive infection protein, partial [bacterium]
WQLLDKPENKERLRLVFTDFNFNLVMAQPKEIVILLLQDKVASETFEMFLLEKAHLGSRDVNLVLAYLCQTDFKSDDLINVLKKNHFMRPIIEVFLSGKIPSQQPGYYDLSEKQVLKISDIPNVIEQIRLRIKAERRDDFSVALNHLLNEIHAICYQFDSMNKIKNNNYQEKETGKFLLSNKVPHKTRIKIRNLFDRRNKNTISHADPVGWSVSKDEYYVYHKHVGICLNHVL